MKKIKRIHFMGIGGSGMTAVSLLAAKEGYEVSGCDLQENTAYSQKIKDFIPNIFVGHSKNHIKNVDALIVTPAVYFVNKDHPEVVEAEKKILVMTWQEFLGKYLTKGKKVICVAGTHGKSTTTAILSLVLIKAGLDPNAIVGATVKEWGANSKEGKSNIFVVEADEFYDNYLSYSPEMIIINNIELDHPDYFHSEKQLIESFRNFVSKLKERKILIVNCDSLGIKKLFDILDKKFLSKTKVIGYTLSDKPLFKTQIVVRGKILSQNENLTKFSVVSKELKLNSVYSLALPGIYNVSNVLGVIAAASEYEVSQEAIHKALSSFKGIGRRLEFIGESHGVKVYDDYAHHPTAIAATLLGLKQKYPKARIWAIDEAHSFSRTKSLLPLYKNAFCSADKVIIGPIFKARDLEDYGMSGQSIVDVVKHQDILYLDSIDKIVGKIKKEAKSGDVILVMGAGESYKWARQILSSL